MTTTTTTTTTMTTARFDAEDVGSQFPEHGEAAASMHAQIQ